MDSYKNIKFIKKLNKKNYKKENKLFNKITKIKFQKKVDLCSIKRSNKNKLIKNNKNKKRNLKTGCSIHQDKRNLNK